MIRDSIKGLLAIKGYKVSDYAVALGLQPSSLTRKFQNDSFTYKDLKVLTELTGTELRIVEAVKADTVTNIKL